jgi:hypothetical protein
MPGLNHRGLLKRVAREFRDFGPMKDEKFLGCLGCTGVAALIVLLFPAAALLGLFLGIVPGLFLGISPSVFVYLVLWWGLRWTAEKIEVLAGFDPDARLARWFASLAAVAIVAIFAIMIPVIVNAPFQQQIGQLQASDVPPSGDIKLPAVVAVELPKSFSGRDNAPYCEEICLRLLYNGVVSRVIAAEILPDGRIEPASSYRIERRIQCPKPDFPILRIVWPGEFRAEPGIKPTGTEERVRARISAGECLVREAGRIDDAETIISLREVKKGANRFRSPWSFRLDTVSARRLEIIEADGRVLYRRTEVTAEPLIVPLITTAEAGFLTTVTYSGWARTRTEVSPLGPNGRDILPSLLGEAARSPDLPDATRSQ